MKKAILYARFSPRPNAAECESCERQLADLREYCRHRGIEIRGEYHDDAMSGADADRPELLNAIASLKRGWLFCVTRIDRLARDNRLAEVFVHDIASRGGRTHTLQGPCDETPRQRFARQIDQAIAELQRAEIRERTSARMRDHQAHGRRMSARTPYGWERDPENPGRMRNNPQEQETIARIRELRGEGNGVRRIARKLAREGRFARCGNAWQTKQIARILKTMEAVPR